MNATPRAPHMNRSPVSAKGLGDAVPDSARPADDQDGFSAVIQFINHGPLLRCVVGGVMRLALESP